MVFFLGLSNIVKINLPDEENTPIAAFSTHKDENFYKVLDNGR